MKNLIIIMLMSVITFFGCNMSYDDVSLNVPEDNSIIKYTVNDLNMYSPNEVLIKYKGESNPKLLKVDNVEKFISEKKKDKNVVYVEPNYLYTIPETEDDIIVNRGPWWAPKPGPIKLPRFVDFPLPVPTDSSTMRINDPYFNELWGLHGRFYEPISNYGSQTTSAWGFNNIGSNDVYVVVLDQGCYIEHEDLTNNLATQYAWDFWDDDATISHGVADYHGTHVSGTIGANVKNSIGVAGMCWNVKIINLKFIGGNGGYTSDAVDAINYMIDLKKTKGLNIIACNCSWGGTAYSQALYDVIMKADSANILMVCSAGNNMGNNDNDPRYPSSYDCPNIISVAAISPNGTKSFFSNYGAKTVDLGAPGDSIWSTVPYQQVVSIPTYPYYKVLPTVSGYGMYRGTSMAAPHVTAACVLYYNKFVKNNPGVNPTTQDIKSGVLNSTIPNSSVAKTTTKGSLNVNFL